MIIKSNLYLGLTRTGPGPGPELFSNKTLDNMTSKSVSYSLSNYEMCTTAMISSIYLFTGSVIQSVLITYIISY